MTVRLSQHLAVLACPFPVLFVSINPSGRTPQARSFLPPIPCDIPELHWAEWCPQQAWGLLQLREFGIKS